VRAALYAAITRAPGIDLVAIDSCSEEEESPALPLEFPAGFILAHPTNATVDAKNIRRSISSPAQALSVRY
jgi:hypothetical protein